MSPRNRLQSLVIVAALAAAATAPAASASSTPADDCVAGPTGTTQCFGTFREAIANASGGRVTDAPKRASKAIGDRRLATTLRRLGRSPARSGSAPNAPRASTRAIGDGSGEIIAATLFDDQDYGGGSYTVTAGAPCKKDGWVEWQIDLPQEWQDRISSVQPWGNCWIWLYPETGLGGERDGPFKENTSYVGPLLDNRTKSVGLS